MRWKLRQSSLHAHHTHPPTRRAHASVLYTLPLRSLLSLLAAFVAGCGFGCSAHRVPDAGIAWLGDPATSLKGLTELDLCGAVVSDAAVKEVARTDTGLGHLTELCLGDERVTEAALKDLARTETGLKALTALVPVNTQVTDAGVKNLARADTGLKGLAALSLQRTSVTDAGVAAVESRWPGISVLH